MSDKRQTLPNFHCPDCSAVIGKSDGEWLFVAFPDSGFTGALSPPLTQKRIDLICPECKHEIFWQRKIWRRGK